ncbi:phage tail fiber domain-containing protein [Enterobacter asburiae]|uniref:phage tail fiber domain-containing protein n=1 Tax=Enterobacter asburiae TaxID=61645 RepID=UPI002649C3B4|nr:phage tail fiber protein [Enterobacter asburiae]WKE01837.1 phage tail fiber protein [Enterobacter asburiae]WKE07859.1 phage tail fiber protein [Enterobacter asburiae]
MSVPNQTPYIIYNANGMTTVFPFEFYIINPGDIQVTINGVEITSGYTVSGTGNVGGGDIIFLTPPAAGSVVMLERVVPTYRLTDYQDNGDLLADTVNKDFDRLWMAIQRSFIYLGLALRRPLLGGPFNAEGYRISDLGEPSLPSDATTKEYVDNVALGRVLRVPESYVAPVPAVSSRANRLLAFNSEGNPIAVIAESGSASDVLIDLASSANGKGDSLIAVKQPFPNSVPRTQHDKNAECISVMDFGAKCDGITDDTIAFKNALAASYHINVPEGEIKITDGLHPRDGTIISGAGKNLTKIKLYDNDVDLITMGWDCVLENLSLESMLPDSPTHTKGLVRWQSTTNPEIPPAAVALGGLSYRNKIRNVELRNGQAYNFYSFGVGYSEWYNTDAVLSRGSANVYLDGSDSYVARGTTLFMHGVNKITACRGGDGLIMNNNFGMQIYGIFEGNKGRAVSVFGYSDSNIIDGYYENNFAPSVGGSGNGDAVVKFESSVTRGCIVKGYFDTLNAHNAVQIHGLATGFNNRAQYSVREYNDQRSFNRKNGFSNLAGINCQWEIDNAQQYYKEADLGEVRSSGKMTFSQCMMYSPFSMIKNPKFNSWSSSVPDSWAGAAVKVSGGYAGSDFYANLNTYPGTFLQQSSINTRLEHSLVHCSLVMVGRGGHSINISSPDYNGTNRTVVIITTASGNTFLEIPQQNFGDDWDVKVISLNEIFSGDLPSKSSITGMTINVYCSAGTNIGYVGLHDNSAGMFIPSDK